ncbi:hypothetical protein OAA38_00845 [bacterium]|nr:hypothetical protein [bacterium]|tara:strand:- start:539 stop:949 length:411 start_codon:yes stop_codon:yes gene_type:complete
MGTRANNIASLFLDGTNATISGIVSDSDGNVRTPRAFSISGNTTITNEGAYLCDSAVSAYDVTIGAPGIGKIMTLYNNSTNSLTLNKGSTVVTMRVAGDNTTTSHDSATLASHSTSTITMFDSNFAIVSGTSITGN